MLNHPGVAAVHFIGQDEQLCYMAMQYIDGTSLRNVMEHLSSARSVESGIDGAAQRLSNQAAGAPAMRFDQPTATFIDEQSPDGQPANPQGLTLEAEALIRTEQYIRRCCEIVRDAALALAHAHARGVVHRDVKPENLLRVFRVFSGSVGQTRDFLRHSEGVRLTLQKVTVHVQGP